jgi:hypothetical protein
MTVMLRRRAEIDLKAFRRVAWEGQGVAIDARARAQIALRRAQLINGAPCAPALLAEVLQACPPIERRRSLGPDLARLSAVLKPSIPD